MCVRVCVCSRHGVPVYMSVCFVCPCAFVDGRACVCVCVHVSVCVCQCVCVREAAGNEAGAGLWKARPGLKHFKVKLQGVQVNTAIRTHLQTSMPRE